MIMKSRSQRLEYLKFLISTQHLQNHEEILAALAKAGYQVNQATLSRDLQAIKAAKVSEQNGQYRYVLPTEEKFRRVATTGKELSLSDGKNVFSISFSQNLAVVKTRMGFASAFASEIDRTQINEVLGTIAGMDTVFIALADHASYSNLITQLQKLLNKNTD